MKIKTILLGCLITFFAVDAHAQFYLKSEYITSSKLLDEEDNKTGGKSDLKIIDGGLRIPLSVKMNENNRPTAWAIAIGATYASMDDKNISDEYIMKEILNTQLGLMHMRPLNEKWSLLAIIGAGIFTSDLGHITGKSILGQGGVMFIKHARPNFDWGVGIALNNAVGYPMVFPSFYLDWKLEGKYKFNLSMYNSLSLELSTYINDSFKLSLTGESNGLMSAVKKDGKDMYFVTQYGHFGIQPEWVIGKSFSIPFTVGVSLTRDTYFQKRTLKSFFEDKDSYPHFDVSAYFSLGIKYGL